MARSRGTRLAAVSLMAGVLMSACAASAQTCGQWETGIGPNGLGGGIPGTDGPINSMVAWDPDGAGPSPELAVVSGRFQIAGTKVVGVPTQFGELAGLAVWDGATWGPFPGPLPPDVPRQQLTLLGSHDNKLIGVVVVNGAARVMAFAAGQWTQLGGNFTGAGYPYLNVMTQYQGDLVITGRFSHVGSESMNSVARWNGVSWGALGEGLSGGEVRALVVHQGRLVAGGSFTSSGSTPCPGGAIWDDGQGWQGMGGGSSALAVVGGVLYGVRGGSWQQSGLATWDGMAWNSIALVPGTPYPTNMSAHLFAHQGSLFTIASFATHGAWGPEDNVRRVAKWTGDRWVPTTPGMPSASAFLFATRGGELLLAPARWDGFLNGYSYLPPSPVRTFDGAVWRAAGDGFDGEVNRLLDLGGGQILAAGTFQSAGKKLTRGLARWDGSAWQPMDNGLVLTTNSPYGDIRLTGAVMFAGQPVVTGPFSGVGGNNAVHGMATWNGAAWGPVGPPGQIGNSSRGVGLFRGDLIAAAATSGSTGAGWSYRIRRFDGTAWSEIPGELASSGAYIGTFHFVQVGEDLVVGGEFSTAGGMQARNIAKWDGLAWSPIGEGLPNAPYGSAGLCMHDGVLHAAHGYGVSRWNGVSWTVVSNPVVTSIGEYVAVISAHESAWALDTVYGLTRMGESAFQFAGGGRTYGGRAVAEFGAGILVGGRSPSARDGRAIGPLARWSTVPDPPVVSVIAPATTEQTGRTAVLRFARSGTGPLTVARVLRNGVDVASGSGSRIAWFDYNGLTGLGIQRVRAEDAGDYRVVIANGCGSVTSDTVSLTVTCSADFNQNGVIDGIDVIDFLRAWFDGLPAANYDGVIGVTITDLFGWLTGWFAGC